MSRRLEVHDQTLHEDRMGKGKVVAADLLREIDVTLDTFSGRLYEGGHDEAPTSRGGCFQERGLTADLWTAVAAGSCPIYGQDNLLFGI